MEKKKALGRGMSSLIPDASLLNDETTAPKTYFYCDVENIIPNREQPRKDFNDESLQELTNSIRERGVLQPILVHRLSEFKYELIAGERRWRAAQKAGFQQVPVIIRESSNSELLEDALIENIQREDLNAIEEAMAFGRLMEEHGYTQDNIANKLGKNRSTIANSVRLLELSKTIQDFVVKKEISAGHARALLSIEDHERRQEAAREIIQRGLSVRQAEALAKIKYTGKTTASSLPEKDSYVAILEQELSQHFKVKVRIHQKGKKGKIEMEFFGEEELNRIVSLLKA